MASVLDQFLKKMKLVRGDYVVIKKNQPVYYAYVFKIFDVKSGRLKQDDN